MGKASYTIEIGDEEIVFEGPDGLTEAEIEQLAAKELRKAKPGQSFKTPVYAGNKVAEPEKVELDESSALGSFLRGTPKEVLFNWDDELVAMGNAYIPGMAALDEMIGAQPGQEYGDYEGNLANIRAQAEADQREHPVANATGSIAGVLSTLPRAAAGVVARAPQAVAARLAERPIAAAIVGGTAGGAVSGAGAGEEGTRAQSAALGAGAGAVLGGGIVGGIQLAPAVARYAKAFFNRGSDQEAVGQIVTALQRDGYDLTSPSNVKELKDLLQEFSGKPVTLADIGNATRSRAGVGLRTPSAEQSRSIDMLEARRAGQGPRIATDVRGTVAPRTDVHTLDEALVNQRAMEAEKLRELALYEDGPIPQAQPRAEVVPTGQVAPEAENAGLLRQMGMEVADNPTFQRLPVPVVPEQAGRTSRLAQDPQLQWLARLPMAQKALNKALDIANAERDRLVATGQSIDHLPDVSAGGTLDFRTLDTLKRYMDQEVNRAFRGQSDTFTMAQASELKALRDSLRTRMREVNPEYGDYLDQYAGSSEMIDALDAGRKFDDLDPEVIAREQGSRSTAAQELYRVGTARNLLDKIKGTPDHLNPANRVLNSPESVEQLRATGVAPDAADRLVRSVGQERTLNKLNAEMGGAQTAQRVMAQADANAGADIGTPFNPGSPIGWGGLLARNVMDKASLKRNAAVNAEIMPRLLNMDPASIERVLGELTDFSYSAASTRAKREAAQRKYAALGGIMIGGAVALPADEEFNYGR